MKETFYTTTRLYDVAFYASAIGIFSALTGLVDLSLEKKLGLEELVGGVLLASTAIGYRTWCRYHDYKKPQDILNKIKKNELL